MDEFQMYYTKWKKPEKIDTAWFHLYKILNTTD